MPIFSLRQLRSTFERRVSNGPEALRGVPAFVAYFWDLVLDGSVQTSPDGSAHIPLNGVDIRIWPELTGLVAVTVRKDAITGKIKAYEHRHMPQEL